MFSLFALTVFVASEPPSILVLSAPLRQSDSRVVPEIRILPGSIVVVPALIRIVGSCAPVAALVATVASAVPSTVMLLVRAVPAVSLAADSSMTWPLLMMAMAIWAEPVMIASSVTKWFDFSVPSTKSLPVPFWRTRGRVAVIWPAAEANAWA